MDSATRFVTFYSYKGGVGRTSALVNSAILRANKGNSVVVIDFDLEAPGTGAYLSQLDPKYNGNRKGILDYLIDCLELDKVPPIKDYAIDLSEKIDKSNGGQLWAIGAGDITKSTYHEKLEKLKWRDIFLYQNGELLLKNFQNQIIDEFDSPDLVLLDSRTGITETGGVCTRYLADAVVILTSLNEQNILGTSQIYKELQEENKKFVLVASNIPVGFPLDEEQLFGKRIKSFQDRFEREPDICIYNYPSLSLNEFLPVTKWQNSKKSKLFQAIYDADPLIKSYTNLAEKVGEVTTAPDSYLTIIKKAADSILYEFDDKNTFEILKTRYSDRLLGQLILQITDWQTMDSLTDVPTLDSERFVNLQNAVEQTSNEHLKRALRHVRKKIWTKIKKYLAINKLEMSEALEIFSNNDLEYQALADMSNNYTTWAYSYLLKQLENATVTRERISAAFNLAMCLERRSDPRSLLYHKKVCELIPINNIKKSPMETQINHYFCYGISLARIKKHADALDMFSTTRKLISAFEKSSVLFFSPLTYKDTSKSDFLSHLDSLEKESAMQQYLGSVLSTVASGPGAEAPAH